MPRDFMLQFFFVNHLKVKKIYKFLIEIGLPQVSTTSVVHLKLRISLRIFENNS
jgi:hypothetical protein